MPVKVSVRGASATGTAEDGVEAEANVSTEALVTEATVVRLPRLKQLLLWRCECLRVNLFLGGWCFF
jgi:hypothetical protein